MAQFLALFIPLLSAVGAWYANERSKRAWEEYKRKEQHYGQLLLALRGFFTSTQSKELREEFLQQVNLCWLYCPDEVIQKAYAFLDTVHEKSTSGTEASEKAMNELVVAVRRDLLSRQLVEHTSLDAGDFRRYTSR